MLGKYPIELTMADGESTSTAPVFSPMEAPPPRTSEEERWGSKLRIMTYNIWNSESNVEARTMGIVSTILRQTPPPHIVGLQEVTPVSLQILHRYLSKHYKVIQGFYNPEHPEASRSYGTVLLVHLTVMVPEVYFYDLPHTRMGRQVVGCEIVLPTTKESSSRKLHILTSHLESLDGNELTRQQQFEDILEILKRYKYPDTILLGDFNICRDEEHRTPEPLEQTLSNSNFKDCWRESGCPAVVKYTFDSSLNQNLRGKRYHSRLDRILFYFKRRKTQLDCLRLVGMASLDETGAPPSDHFGLQADLLIE